MYFCSDAAALSGRVVAWRALAEATLKAHSATDWRDWQYFGARQLLETCHRPTETSMLVKAVVLNDVVAVQAMLALDVDLSKFNIEL